ncbi:glutathione metabolism protein [Phreatobacter aquaticus]|uniref:Glutathione metabolism protein n=1 Tax=Phreatobacter aquaticus TaxID=2570229 RepID=A0A4D7QEH5_9HYPH|nr:MAPEG family protein [Phreatobacter aquaticus]QCK85175.1 glutathione metabolism protein [Phreatobacter aquaticus]
MPITAFYAALLVPIFLVLSLRVINGRRDGRVALGDGGDPGLLRRMRVHANFAEYVPLALILIGLAESLGIGRWIIHALGITLLAARLLHAYGVSQPKENFRLRVAGMISTIAVISTAALACLLGAVSRGIGF